MRKKIYRCMDENECRDVKTGEAVPFLSYHRSGHSAEEVNAKLEELVNLCDQDAENCNAHDFCGTHRLLGAVLFRQYGREAATKTFMEIASFGGLHGMSGIPRGGAAYGELKVGRSGHDWGGSYE